MSTPDDPTVSADAPQDPRDDPRWDLVRATARSTVPTPSGLIARVLRSVNGVRGQELAEPSDFPLGRGRLRVSEQVVVLIARQLGKELGQELGGVHISAVELEADGLQVLVTVRYGIAADEAADLLRARLDAALADRLGVPAPQVHVHIVDAHSP